MMRRNLDAHPSATRRDILRWLGIGSMAGLAVVASGTRSGLAATSEPPAAAILPSSSIVTWGQSNGSYIHSFAHAEWDRAIGTLLPSMPTRLVQGATAGTFLRRSSAAGTDDYWVDDTVRPPVWGPVGRVFADALSAEIANGRTVRALVGAGHESEAGKIRTEAHRRAYKEVQAWVFEEARSMLAAAGQAPAPVFIVPLGRRGEADYPFGEGVQSIKRIQHALARENAWIHLLPENYDLETDGGAHLRTEGQPNGYQLAVPRQTRKVARILGATVAGGVDGPRIAGAVRRARRVVVSIAHDGGTDLAPTSGIEGFRYTADEEEIAIEAAERTDAATVTLTLASLPSGGRETLFYGYGTLAGTRPSAILRDDQTVALPLRSFEGTPEIRRSSD